MLVKLNGPFWTADFVIVDVGGNRDDPALRALFARPNSSANDESPEQIASAAVSLGYVTRLEVELTPAHQFGWSREAERTIPETATPENIRSAIESGELCLILAAIIPDDAESRQPIDTQAEDADVQTAIPQWRCLNGQIPILSSMIPDASATDNNDTQRLFKALQLESATPDNADADSPRTGAAGRRAAVSVTSSGLSVLGKTKLPWLAKETFSSPFLLTRQVHGPGFELTIEEQRLTPAEQNALRAGWSSIGQSLSGSKSESGSSARNPRHNWLTLEIMGVTELPTITWHFNASLDDPSLRIRSSENTSFSVLFSDQAPDSETPAETLARLRLEELAIANRKGKIVVSGQAGVPGDASEGVLKYTVSKRAAADASEEDSHEQEPTDPDGFIESFATSGSLDCVIDPIDTARLLRRAAGTAAPKWFAAKPVSNLKPTTHPDPPELLNPPVLWGFVPLSDGWAQLPVPNLTEQIYLDAKLDKDATDTEENVEESVTEGLLHGAVQFGNASDRSDSSDEHAWNATLTQFEEFSCTWTLERVGGLLTESPEDQKPPLTAATQPTSEEPLTEATAGALTIVAVEARIRSPQLTINGLFWMSTEQPSAADALPTLSAPHGGLEQISINTIAGSLQRFPSLINLQDFQFQFTARALGDNEALGVQAHLNQWSFRLSVNERLLKRAAGKGVFSETLFEEYPPWAWLRHPTLPMIQALPMTQSMDTAGQPCSSRQLVPFELPLPHHDTPWTLGVSSKAGAAVWPTISLKGLSPSPLDMIVHNTDGGWPMALRNAESRATRPVADSLKSVAGSDLPLVSLTVPGVIFQPNEAKTVPQDFPLRLQYRFDVPALDEVNALAELPEPENAEQNETSEPTEDSDTILPLTRDTISEHWRLLAERAALAAADSVDAFQITTDSSDFQNLVEPIVVSASPKLEAQYPGELTIAKLNQALSGKLAQKGISGSFGAAIGFDGLPNSAAYEINAGSMTATKTADHEIRDQRGLIRSPAIRANGLLKTPLRFQKDVDSGTGRKVTLTSTVKTEKLHFKAGNWLFWMRDVPFDVAPDSGTQTFKRSNTRSDLNEDNNDPEALAREHNFLCGYEWRLQNGGGGTSKAEHLSLFNLDFFPLTLESVVVTGKSITFVEMIGRLQLPLGDRAEVEELNNCVRVVFERPDRGSLDLKSVTPLAGKTADSKSFGEWPLASGGDGNVDAPRICWNDIRLVKKTSLLVKGEFRFLLFDVPWCVPIEKGLTFGSASAIVEWSRKLITPGTKTPNVAMQPALVALTLNLKERKAHTASLTIKTAFGDEASGQLLAELVYQLVNVDSPKLKNAELFGAYSLKRDDVSSKSAAANGAPLVTDNAIGNRRSLQFSWFGDLLSDSKTKESVTAAVTADTIDGVGVSPDLDDLDTSDLDTSDEETSLEVSSNQESGEDGSLPRSFLPGMPLDGASRHATGFAAVTFEAVFATNQTTAVADATATDTTVANAPAEASAAQPTSAAPGASTKLRIPTLEIRSGFLEMLLPCRWKRDLERESGPKPWSSQGDVMVSYTSEWSPASIDQESRAKLPAAWQTSLLLNGSLRINNLISWPTLLLENRDLDAEVKVPSLASRSGQIRHSVHVLLNQHELPLTSLQRNTNPKFIHQLKVPLTLLAVVEHQIEWDAGSGNSTKWTSVQDVRFFTPDQFSETVRSASGRSLLFRDPDREVTAVDYALADDSGGGNDAQNWLTDAENSDVMIVDASAPHWVRRTPLQQKSLTNLQYLPTGTQRASLSHIDDFAPSDPDDPEWIMLQMPFVARLLSGQSGLDENPLLVHPSEVTVQAKLTSSAVAFFCGRSLGNSITRVTVSAFDTAAGRTWAALDPLSLEENWFRIQNPPIEKEFDGVVSVMAARPPAPASLSRAAALRQAVMAIRPLWVSEDTPGRNLLQNPNFRGGRFGAEPPVVGAIPEGWVVFRFGNTYLPTSSGTAAELRRKLRRADLPRLNIGIKELRASRARVLTISSESIVTTVEIGQQVVLSPGDYELVMSVFPRPERVVSSLTEEELRRGSRVVLFAGGNSSRSFDATVVRVRLPFTIDKKQELNVGVRLYGEKEFGCGGWQIGNPRLVRLGVLAGVTAETGRVRRHEADLTDTESDQLLVHDFRTPGTSQRPVVSGWHLAAAQFRSLFAENKGIMSHAAATILPVHELVHDQLNHIPVGFAVSPYSSIEFTADPHETRETPAADTRQLYFAELICLNGTHTAMRSVETKLIEDDQPGDVAATERAQRWARQLHRSMCPESPVAVLRYRRLSRRVEDSRDKDSPDKGKDSSTKNEVQLSYSFETGLLAGVDETFAKRVFSLRTLNSFLRFREGQFGGYRVPDSLRDFELAPPLAIGVQPVYLTQRPQSSAAKDSRGAARTPWPWGWSGLRLSIQYTEDSKAVLGSRIKPAANAENAESEHPRRLWWQSVSYVTQFRSAVKNENAAGLPQGFRAKAIKSLQPVLPKTPLPDPKFVSKVASAEDVTNSWLQPVLPGQLTCVVVGSRPGVMMATRTQLTQQTIVDDQQSAVGDQTGATDAQPSAAGIQQADVPPESISGSVPVQHRMPRPVPLPPNLNTETALRTWAESAMKDRTVFVDTTPSDIAFFEEMDGLAAERIAVSLISPQAGVLSSTWDGRIEFHIESDPGTDAAIAKNLQIHVDGEPTPFSLTNVDERKVATIDFTENTENMLNEWSKSEGTSISLSLRRFGSNQDSAASATPTEPPREMSFRLKYAEEGGMRAPVIPWFARFEDPEYNRKLASVPATAAGMYPEAAKSDSDEAKLHPVSLSADRREYNPESKIAFRWDWTGDPSKEVPSETPTLKLAKVSEGLTIPLTADPDVDLTAASLLTISEASLKADGAPVKLIPGDLILLAIRFEKADFELSLSLRIVAEPVIPKPEAAYALLRAETPGAQPAIACSRFAWSPEPTRVELVSAEDLRTGLVRRRAVFLWQDAARAGSVSGFAIQKISKNGSTHVPSYPEDFRLGRDISAANSVEKQAPSPPEINVDRSSTRHDPLESITGIGPVIGNALRAAGIVTIEQLSESSVEHLSRILSEADVLLAVHNPGSWIEQAKMRVQTPSHIA